MWDKQSTYIGTASATICRLMYRENQTYGTLQPYFPTTRQHPTEQELIGQVDSRRMRDGITQTISIVLYSF